MKLDVNTGSAIQLTAKLEKLHKSAFPNAVRNTLNDVAFETKKLIPKKAEGNFTIRQKNLFKRMSLVEKAQGWNVNGMVSKVGLDGSKGSLSDGLEKQETGGNLKGRKLIAHRMGRVSNSSAKKVKSKNQFKNIGNIGTSKRRVKGSKYFRIDKGSKGTVFEKVGKRITPIYNYRSNPITKLKKQPFIEPSAKESIKQMEMLYKKNAEFQFKKHLK